jgi:hypothetical protein
MSRIDDHVGIAIASFPRQPTRVGHRRQCFVSRSSLRCVVSEAQVNTSNTACALTEQTKFFCLRFLLPPPPRATRTFRRQSSRRETLCFAAKKSDAPISGCVSTCRTWSAKTCQSIIQRNHAVVLPPSLNVYTITRLCTSKLLSDSPSCLVVK